MKLIAIESTPSSRNVANACRTSASSSGWCTTPSARMRSVTGSRSRRGPSGRAGGRKGAQARWSAERTAKAGGGEEAEDGAPALENRVEADCFSVQEKSGAPTLPRRYRPDGSDDSTLGLGRCRRHLGEEHVSGDVV